MYCLDSTIVIEIFTGNKALESHLLRIDQSELGITSITLCELYKGAFLSANLEKKLNLIKEFLDKVVLLELDNESCRLYGKIYSELKSQGKLTQDLDLMIASICIANNHILITKNKKHFENIKGLRIEGW